MTQSSSRKTRQNPVVQLVMTLFAICVSIIVILSAASNFATTLNPDLAIALNPLNTPARLYKLTNQFSETTNDAETSKLKELAIQGIKFDPIDARLFSLLGVAEERQNKIADAQRKYVHALKLLPTEIHALQRRFFFNLSTAKFVKAVSQADIILRRWPLKWGDVTPYMYELLRHKDAYDEALKLFSLSPIARYRLVDSLNKDVKSVAIARKLIRDWHAQGIDDLQLSINRISIRLIKFKEYLSAYRLFLLTLNSDQKLHSGYIFNGNFDLSPSGNIFDWQIPNQAGMNAEIRKIRSGSNSAQKFENVFVLRFLDSPVRFSKVLQRIILPPSKFTLKLSYSTQALKTNKPIKFQVECSNKNKPLASFSFEPGNNEKRQFEIKFEVPASDCELQQLKISNDNFVESWRNRYSGTLLLHNISISLDGV